MIPKSALGYQWCRGCAYLGTSPHSSIPATLRNDDAHFLLFAAFSAAASFSAASSFNRCAFIAAFFSSNFFCASFCCMMRSCFSDSSHVMPFFANFWLRTNLQFIPSILICRGRRVFLMPLRWFLYTWLLFVWFLDFAIASTC